MTLKEILAVKRRALARRQKVSICSPPLCLHTKDPLLQAARLPCTFHWRPVQLQLSPESLDGFPQPPHLFL